MTCAGGQGAIYKAQCMLAMYASSMHAGRNQLVGGRTILIVTGSIWNPKSEGAMYAMAKGLKTASREPALTSWVTTMPRPLPVSNKQEMVSALTKVEVNMELTDLR